MSTHLSYLEAGVVGAIQGVAELFPISSLGHSVLIPAWIGGSWAPDLDVSSPESPYRRSAAGMAARDRHDPGGADRAAARALVANHPRSSRPRRDLPHSERTDPAGCRAVAWRR